jgi:predicted PurR-regulated permease PerM
MGPVAADRGVLTEEDTMTENNENTNSGTDQPFPPRDRLEGLRTAMIAGIFFLMVMYTLYLAASLILPIVLALLLSLILSPVVGLMAKMRVPTVLGGLLVMLSIATLIAAALYAVGSPAAQWIDKAPDELRKLEYKLAWVKEPIREINEAREQVEELTGGGDTTAAPRPSFSLIDAILTRTPDVMFGIAVMLILLFFLLASGDAFLNKLVRVTPEFRDKRRVVEAARDIQRHVSVYLGTITLINLCVAVVVGLLMYGLGMPNPILWGTMAGVLNFIPYLGVGITILIVGFVSALTFDTIGQILLPPLSIFAVNVVEGQFLTPIIAGRRLALSPVAIFLALVVLGWIWGMIWVLIAVPVLATIKLVCEHIGPLQSLAILLGQD